MNLDSLERIASAVEVPLQAGGGLRDTAAIDAVLDAGAERVVLGTAAMEDPALLRSALQAHAERLVVSVDASGGRVALRGWTEPGEIDPARAVRELSEQGVRRFTFTPIEVDGTMEGPGIEQLRRVAGATDAELIYSGGVGNLEHLRSLAAEAPANVAGVIVGRALYEGKLLGRRGSSALVPRLTRRCCASRHLFRGGSHTARQRSWCRFRFQDAGTDAPDRCAGRALRDSIALIPAAANAALPVHYSAPRQPQRARHHKRITAGRQRLRLQAQCRPSLPGCARPRHAGEHGLQLECALAAAENNGYCVFALNYGQEAGRLSAHRGRRPRAAPRASRTRRCSCRLRQRVAPLDRGNEGRPRRPQPGRDDAALLPEVPRGASKVHDLVGLSPSNHGTTVNGLTRSDQPLPGRFRRGDGNLRYACTEQLAGSASFRTSTAAATPWPRELHSDRDPLRRSRHAVYVGLPLGAQHDQHHSCRTSAGWTSASTLRRPSTTSPCAMFSTRSTRRTRNRRPVRRSCRSRAARPPLPGPREASQRQGGSAARPFSRPGGGRNRDELTQLRGSTLPARRRPGRRDRAAS